MKFLSLAIIFLFANGCLTEAVQVPTPQAGTNDQGTSLVGDKENGTALYAAYCADCHKALDAPSDKVDRSSSAIFSASSVSSHNGISNGADLDEPDPDKEWFTEQESADLAAALSTAPEADVDNGLTLFNDTYNCDTCHFGVAPIGDSSASNVFAASSLSAHGSIDPWPSETESTDMAAAIDQLKADQ
ncbi:hypothetical protein [Pseudobacteriovorax antillogorgiicola]|uniref:Cytochrome c domain-containing protein n=1 Tax=Pseudobacteriovorax antillogorgiicola TaxID=1513793 RepID=A0A1Y6C1Q0_9BACT|nr:hypothetical protein [Pseudobacteriovorax antillogorgiicola]TCS52266.1 hypothetical protein EDD56_10910 [Pseudobacteriovorax antillogorgiicola]SMF30932.1 hypothetical protein SAMN06296036_109203 [Pseudobacteriovorax antillogorgiicola]